MKKKHAVKTPNPAVYICDKTLGSNGSKYFFAESINGDNVKIELFGNSYFFSLAFSHNSKFSIDS